MRVVIGILLLPFLFSFGKGLFQLFILFDLSNGNQLWFWLSCLVSFLFSFLRIPNGSYLATFEHEITHNLWAILTFNKPSGFHIHSEGGGQFEYYGKGNVFISLSPYFFPTTTYLVLPLYFVFNPNLYWLFFAILGLTFGFQISTNIKETKLYQTDLKKNGILLSIVLIILFTFIFFGIILAFVTFQDWQGVMQFIINGFLDVFDSLKTLL